MKGIAIEHRGGFALPAALLALVVVGALVTGGLYAAMEEDRSSANLEHGSHAFLAAEQGMQQLLGTKTKPYFQDSVGAVGTADTVGPVAVTVNGVPAQYTLFVQRLNSNLFKVDAEGEVTGGGRYAGSRRRIAEFMRINTTLLPIDRAITTQSPIRMRGQSGVNGDDAIPAGWTDCTDTGVRMGVVANSNDPKYIDIKGAAGITGNPEDTADLSLSYDKFLEYGDMHLDDLKRYANHTLPPGTYSGAGPSTSGGVCNTSDPTNWGDPNNPSGACHYYWPIIHVPGDMHISGGSLGQGILIVDGDLSVVGNFEFSGIVFVYGGFKAAGTGNKIVGSLNLFGAADTTELGDPNQGQGNTQIQLSSCAIERAHRYNTRFARPIPLGVRKFVDISGLGVN
jgi:hypothetical protein